MIVIIDAKEREGRREGRKKGRKEGGKGGREKAINLITILAHIS